MGVHSIIVKVSRVWQYYSKVIVENLRDKKSIELTQALVDTIQI